MKVPLHQTLKDLPYGIRENHAWSEHFRIRFLNRKLHMSSKQEVSAYHEIPKYRNPQ